MSKLTPGIYIHIPFCIRKCIYCDFNSYTNVNSDMIDSYFQALYKEAEMVDAIFAGRQRKPAGQSVGYGVSDMAETGKFDITVSDAVAPDKFNIEASDTDMLDRCDAAASGISAPDAMMRDTLFIGGGTPSSVEGEYFNELMKRISLSKDAEVTMEANPGTLTEKKLHLYKESGINRISLGVQSFNDDELKFLGRIHDAKEAEQAVQMAKGAGFDNINMDLIFGFPGHDMKSWQETLKKALSLEPQHLSFYSIQIEEGTRLYEMFRKDDVEQITEELNREMYHYAVDFLKTAGFVHYEISNASLPGRECRHNLKYWDMSPYVGIGAGAHSFFKGRRFYNPERIEDYIEFINSRFKSFGNINKKTDYLNEIECFGNQNMLRANVKDAFTDENIALPYEKEDGAGENTLLSVAKENLTDENISLAGENMKSVSESFFYGIDVYENSLEDDMSDYIFTGLRRIKGIEIQDFNDRFNADFEKIYGGRIRKYIEEGFLDLSEGWLRFTDKGLDITNYILADLI